MALVSKNFSDIITFSRASAATRVNASGLVESVAANTPRFDYDPITLAARGILIEEQRTNLLTYSEQFDNAAWTLNNPGTRTANTDVAPDGTTTADTVTDNITNNFTSVRQTVTVANNNQQYTCSVYFKKTISASSFPGFSMSLTGGTVKYASGALNTTTGVATARTGEAPDFITVTDTGTYWRVQWGITNNTSGNTSLLVDLIPAVNTDASATWTATTTGSTVIWGAQLEAGSFHTSYIPSTVTFTGRSSTGTFIGANGLIQTAASGVARYQYNPANLSVAPFLLLEESRTNLWLHSENATNWGNPFNISASTNAAIAPDGATTADKLVENGSNVPHRFEYNFTATASTTYTLSFFAKQAERSQLVLFAFTDNFVFSAQGATFDLAGGTVLSATSGTVADIQSVGNGWYRCSWRITSNAFGTTATAYFGVGPGVGGSSAYQGDGTSGILVWGAQLETGSYPTSYIPTTTAQVTRAADTSTSSQTTRSADVASVNTLSPWYNATEGTLYCESTKLVNDGGYSASIDDGISNAIGIASDLNGQFVVFSSGVLQANIDCGTPFYTGQANRLAGAYKANDFAASLNGSAAATDASGLIPNTVTRLSLGGLYTLNGHIRSIKYFPRRLSNTELQTLTS